VYNNLNEEQDRFKNSWTNVVSSTGIVVNAGDTIEIDQIIVNSKGATDDVIELTGVETEEGFVDNQVSLEYSYYINHNGSNTARMPFINHKIYRGQNTILTPYQQNDAKGIPTNGGVEGRVAIKRILSRRSLGEMFFPPKAESGVFDPLTYYDGIQNTYCAANMLLRLSTTQTGGGLANTPASGFRVGDICSTLKVGGAGTGTGLLIKIESITTSGEITGIVDSWSVYNMGSGYDNDINNGFQLTPQRLGRVWDNATDGTQHVLSLNSYPDLDTFAQSGLENFDGKRFYLLGQGYTGQANAGELIGGGTPSTDALDIDNLVEEAKKRTQKLKIDIEAGFMTPDNLGAIITDQLHEPTLVDKTTNSSAEFFDYPNFQFFHQNPDDTNDLQQNGNPVIITTPTYTPQTCNFYPEGIPPHETQLGVKIPTKGSFASARRIFYNNIAFEKVNRYIGLKDIFYNFLYFVSDAKHENDIFSGVAGSDTEADIGDFGNIKTGSFGSRVVIMNTLGEDGTSENALLNKGGLVLTNMLWTSANLDRIQKGFRLAEEYLGDLSLNVDATSDNFKNNLCVNLDLGLYDDELSAQQLSLNRIAGQSAPANQRTCFCNFDEATTSNTCERFVDFSIALNGQVPCNGNQNNLPLNADNDGQQLSSMWVKSRFQEGFQIINPNPDGYTGDTIDLTQFYAEPQASGAFKTDVVGAENKYFEGNTFLDPENNNLKTSQDCINDARSRDIAVVAVFPQDFSNGSAAISAFDRGGRNHLPIIAFVAGIKHGSAGMTDFINLGNPANEWKVDLFNSTFGTQLGFDPSFTRNKAVGLINPKLGDLTPNVLENYLNYMYIGAVNPSISFNPTLSRFEITGLNTPTVEGNGIVTDIPETITANSTPEQQVFKVNRSGQVCPQVEKITYSPAPADGAKIRSQFGDAFQKEGSILQSQSGISFESMSLFNQHGVETILDPLKDENKYNNTLFEKMGFKLNQLFPEFGSENAFFVNKFVIQETNPTYYNALVNVVKPFTNGSYISSAEIQPLSLNELGMPLFDLGGSGIRQASPAVENAPLTAFKLPTKLDYPYLCIYSSIPSQGTDTIYVGGEDGYSRLPCMGYMTRQNNEGDFFYNGEQTFEFTATKDFTITEIDTEVRLPDGKRPSLEPHSAVIYKITKQINSLPPQSASPPKRDKKKSR
jgi:hypothetical protein